MNKQQAAESLGISVRALERYLSNGSLKSGFTKGKTGMVVDISEEDLEVFRPTLKASPVRSVTNGEAPPESSANRREASTDGASRGKAPKQEDSPEPTRTLALTGEASPNGQGNWATMQILADLHTIAEAIRVGDIGGRPTVADLATKHMLTPQEASELSGASENAIRVAIKNGELRARKQGRGWKVQPEDVKQWVAKMFAEG